MYGKFAARLSEEFRHGNMDADMSLRAKRMDVTNEGSGPRSRGSLVKRVGNDLRAEIASGCFAIGDKLPSQAELSKRFDVSRTVVREAIASLEADGLVEAHQGAGVFVVNLSSQPALPFKIADPARISSLIEMLELRAAVEIEAAGLAAQRRSPAQEEEILQAHRVVAALAARGERSTEADFAFHKTIARATNNPRFPEFLDLLGPGSIPRGTLQAGASDPQFSSYLQKIIGEHREIAQAISAGDHAAAREAMRAHLIGSQQRYRTLIRPDLTDVIV